MADNNDKLDNEQTRAPEPPPKEAPFARPEPAGAAVPPVKRHTSRVPLPEGVAPAAPSAVPKTIRVIRPPSAGATPLPQPGASSAMPPQMAAAAKAKTSRISLESAIGVQAGGEPEAGTAGDGAPKTIRLKRPSEMPTLKVPAVQQGAPAPAVRATGPILPPASGPSKTARIIGADGVPAPAPLPMPEATPTEIVPTTQKRTIRVKRPGAISVSAARASESADREGDAPVLVPVSPEEALGEGVSDSCNPFFIVAAAASIIITGTLIVIFYQQLFGPAALY